MFLGNFPFSKIIEAAELVLMSFDSSNHQLYNDTKIISTAFMVVKLCPEKKREVFFNVQNLLFSIIKEVVTFDSNSVWAK